MVFQLESTFRSTDSNQVGVRLFNITTSMFVPNTQLTTSSTAPMRKRSSAFNMVDGNEYRLQVGVTAGAAGAVAMGSIVATIP